MLKVLWIVVVSHIYQWRYAYLAALFLVAGVIAAECYIVHQFHQQMNEFQTINP